MEAAWNNPIFQETASIVLAVLFGFGIFLFPFRKKNPNAMAAWASLQSWLFGAPLVLLILGSPNPYPFVGLCGVAILGMKEYFQMTGMYHRSGFVWLTYICIAGLGYCCYVNSETLYNLMPMILLATISIIPILQNNAKHMIQYLGLTILGFMFIGWAFMHTAWIVRLEHGPLFLIYIIILSEMGDHISLAVSRLYGGKIIADRITNHRTLEGLVISAVCTVILGFGLRHMLPNSNEVYWIASSLTAILVGGSGDLILSVIRRDLGVRDTGAFIIGRGGFLDRLDRLVFVAPVFYYVMKFLGERYSNI